MLAAARAHAQGSHPCFRSGWTDRAQSWCTILEPIKCVTSTSQDVTKHMCSCTTCFYSSTTIGLFVLANGDRLARWSPQLSQDATPHNMRITTHPRLHISKIAKPIVLKFDLRVNIRNMRIFSPGTCLLSRTGRSVATPSPARRRTTSTSRCSGSSPSPSRAAARRPCRNHPPAAAQVSAAREDNSAAMLAPPGN